MAETEDPPPTGDVMGNLPRTRPGHRSARRAPIVPAAAAATTKRPPRPRATAAQPTAKPRAAAPEKTAKPRPAPGTRRAAASSPVPPAPRSGWATPRPEGEAPSGLDVAAVVGDAVRQGERLVRGVLRKLTPR